MLGERELDCRRERMDGCGLDEPDVNVGAGDERSSDHPLKYLRKGPVPGRFRRGPNAVDLYGDTHVPTSLRAGLDRNLSGTESRARGFASPLKITRRVEAGSTRGGAHREGRKRRRTRRRKPSASTRGWGVADSARERVRLERWHEDYVARPFLRLLRGVLVSRAA